MYKKTVDCMIMLNDTVAIGTNFNEGDILFAPAIGDTVPLKAVKYAWIMRWFRRICTMYRFAGGSGVNAQ